jgi:hypothetical protein
MRSILLRLGVLILLVGFLAGCSTTEYTERRTVIEQREIVE